MKFPLSGASTSVRKYWILCVDGAFVFETVYMGPQARREHGRIETVLRTLFEHHCEHPEEVPVAVPGASPAERVVDYLAGMTDRYCIREFQGLTVPRSFA